jgi:hypothetical protein
MKDEEELFLGDESIFIAAHLYRSCANDKMQEK